MARINFTKQLQDFLDFLILKKQPKLETDEISDLVFYNRDDFKQFLKIKKLPKTNLFEFVQNPEELKYKNWTFQYSFEIKPNSNNVELSHIHNSPNSALEQFYQQYDKTYHLDVEDEKYLVAIWKKNEILLEELQTKIKTKIKPSIIKTQLEQKYNSLKEQSHEVEMILFQALAKQGIKLSHQKSKQSFFYNSGLDGVDSEDLVAQIYSGFLETLKRFEPSKNFRLTTTYQSWVNQKMNHHIQNSAKFIRLPANKIAEINFLKTIIPTYYWMQNELSEQEYLEALTEQMCLKFRNKYTTKYIHNLIRFSKTKTLSFDRQLDEENSMSTFIREDTMNPEEINLSHEIMKGAFDFLEKTFKYSPAKLSIFLKKNDYPPYSNSNQEKLLFNDIEWKELLKQCSKLIKDANNRRSS